MFVGPLVVIVALVVIGPIAVMAVGAIWSVILGWLLVDDAETRAEGQPT